MIVPLGVMVLLAGAGILVCAGHTKADAATVKRMLEERLLAG